MGALNLIFKKSTDFGSCREKLGSQAQMERDIGQWMWAIINSKLTLREEPSIPLQNIRCAS